MKTKSNRYKQQALINEIKKREFDWKYVFAFLIGALFSQITARPFSDLIFFWRSSNGVPLTPLEQVFYWYYLPAIDYAIFFVIAIVILYLNKMSPKSFIYVIFIFTGISMGLSLYILGFDPILVLLLVFPLVILFTFITYEIVIHVKERTIVL